MVRRAIAVACAAAGLTLAVVVGPAAASGHGARLVVSSPPAPVAVHPGSTTATTILVGNLSSAPLPVTVTAASVQLLNNGATRFTHEASDPTFGRGVTISPARLTLAPRSEHAVRITIRAPRAISPNDYFLGFLVTPIVTSPSVAVVNQVGALVVVDIPGSRDERIAASYVGVPSFALSGSVNGYVQVKSVGRSTVQYSTQTIYSGTPTPSQHVSTVLPVLLPPGLTREMPVQVSSWLGIGVETLHTTLVYDLSNQRTGEVVLSKTVILVDPWWFLLPVVLCVAIVLIVRRRRRRRMRRKATPSSPRKGPQHARRRSKELVKAGR